MHEHVVDHYGARAWGRIVDAVPPADRDQLGALLITAAWYPVGLWNRAWRAHLETSGGDPAAETPALALRAADADLHMLFKLTLKLASPTQVVRRSDWLWRRYFDAGGVTIHEDSPAQFRARLEAPIEEDSGPSETLCTYGVGAWLTHALGLSGATKAKVEHTRCRFAFYKQCEYRITW
jgi:hypothetical protein